MSVWMRRILAAVLAVALCCPGSAVFATETEPAQTEPAAVETEPAETEPEETEPEETEPEKETDTYTIDTESEIYRICQELTAEMVYDQLLIYEATADEILYADTREGPKLYPASTTKLFSSYVALQYLAPGELITAGKELELVHAGSSVAYVGKNHVLSVQKLVEGMMLPSGNDAALVLATAAGRRIAEDETLAPEEAVAAFVQEMNRMAKELGFERSHFSNPDGWHTGSHYTCLNDMARIAKLALANKTISKYIRKFTDDVIFESGHAVTWENTNLLLNPDKGFYRSDAIGMKTGFTRQAEYCLMSAFKCSGGKILVIGAFGYEDENQRYRDVCKLANACKEQMK